MTRDAVSATIVAGRRAQIRLNIEVNINKLISTLIYLLNEHAQGRPPLRWHGFITSMLLEGEQLHHHGDGVW
jgi:hypothetical protein